MKTKICTKCKKELPITEFHKGTNNDGLHCWCKICNKKFRRTIEYQEYHKIYKRKYYQNHKQKCLTYVKKYQQNEKYLEYQKSPKAIYRALRKSSKARNIKLLINEKEFINWYDKQIKLCHYCGRTLEEIKNDSHYHRTNKLTIDRKNNNIGYILDNIVLACWICNNIKSNLFTQKEMSLIGKTLKNILI